MVQIKRIYSSALPTDRAYIEQVKQIFRAKFSVLSWYADKIPGMLDRPFYYGYKTILLVSLTSSRKVNGFALILHFPEINVCYLDSIAMHPEIKGLGLGSSLFEAARDMARQLGTRSMYLESEPDDPKVVKDEALLRENRRQLKFYEYYGVRPIMGTAYAMPIGTSPAFFLLFDGLGRREALRRSECRAAVQFILARKNRNLFSPDYITKVVASILDDPVRIRPPRYIKQETPPLPIDGRLQKAMAIVATDEHRIPHVNERGYVERPTRVEELLDELRSTSLFNEVECKSHGEKLIREVHDPDFVSYLKVVCEKLDPSYPVYPYVFPVRRPEKKPKELAVRAGYYCIDTFTPLNRNTYRAARSAVDVALTSAEEVLGGRPVAYALCRPPGHHAGRRVFGGFCYFNNAAIAAHHLSKTGKVAVLDIDFHHGNGTQDIFWNRADVLTASIHGHPNIAYPYFSGYADEVGEGFGRGYNRNFPLPENIGEEVYMQTLARALETVERFMPMFFVVSLGYDIMKGDPTGSFGLGASSMGRIARSILSTNLPILIVQEGGYNLRNLRDGSKSFFRRFSADMLERDKVSMKTAGKENRENGSS
jgi:acetoin utilization deacetylase AcuC-like enzyme/GNAT superfamily N-acetyltransferase